MDQTAPGFTNPETAKQFETSPDFNWNRKIGIMGLYNGHVKDMPPAVAEKLIAMGRTDLKKKVIAED